MTQGIGKNGIINDHDYEFLLNQKREWVRHVIQTNFDVTESEAYDFMDSTCYVDCIEKEYVKQDILVSYHDWKFGKR